MAEVGGVIVVDVDALRALLRVVGPVEVGGVRYTADTVRGELLREQYRRFDDRDVGATRSARWPRRSSSGIEAGDWELEDLATALVDAVQRPAPAGLVDRPGGGRRRGDAVGADGHLREDSLGRRVARNRGADKLDSYLDTTPRPRAPGRRRRGCGSHLTYTIDNGAPASGPPYLLGPNIEGLEAGEHRAIVVVNLPAGHHRRHLDGGPPSWRAATGRRSWRRGSCR